MSNDKEALNELAQVSDTGLPHAISHYLYFAKRASATSAAGELRSQGFEAEERLGADGTNWLVLATHQIVPSDAALETVRQTMERLAAHWRGEYDGWEARIERVLK